MIDIFGRKHRKEQKEKVEKAVKFMLADHDTDGLSDEERYVRHVQNILRMQAEEEKERMKS